MSASTALRIALGSSAASSDTPAAPSVRPILDDVRRAGFEGVLVQDGKIHLEMKWPGLSTMAFTLEDLETFSERLVQEDPPAETPAQIYTRTASVDSEGNLSGQFSYKAKSRSLVVPSNEREALAALIREQIAAAKAAVEKYNSTDAANKKS